MAILDRIKFEGMLNGNDWLVYRYPGESFTTGSQLIVGEGQVAVFIKGGQALDYFTAGTYTLSTSNIPLLQGIINLPFGSKTPFTAEVYFINKTSKLDLNWGTIDPIQLIDPKYHIKLRIRAFGQFALKVTDYRVFLSEIIGSMNARDVVSFNKLVDYFKGILVMKAKSLIAKAIINKQISALEISASIDEISEFCKTEISPEFNRFGIEVVNFYVHSINFPDEDFEEINKILSDRASFDIIGDQRYKTKRTFDTMEAAAGNEGGVAGTMVGAGAGLGIGFGVGEAITSQVSQVQQNSSDQNSCRKCGKLHGPGVSFCGECGNALKAPEAPCPNCGEMVSVDNKFCGSCGQSTRQKNICSQCQAENEVTTKFCKDCGNKLGG